MNHHLGTLQLLRSSPPSKAYQVNHHHGTLATRAPALRVAAGKKVESEPWGRGRKVESEPWSPNLGVESEPWGRVHTYLRVDARPHRERTQEPQTLQLA